MDELKVRREDLVHLLRLGMEGRTEDVAMLGRRLAHRLRISAPGASKEIERLYRHATGSTDVMRRAAPEVPVDSDSQLALLRIESPVVLPVEPKWATPISKILDQVLAEHRRAAALSKHGLVPSRGLLFTGPPGVGKTLAARWLARALSKPLMTLDLSAVVSSYLGRTGNNLKLVLEYAKDADGVLLLDELDAIAKSRDDGVELGELKRLVTVLLQEIDAWPAGRLLIAATNHPALLDRAVWRRFDLVMEFGLPGYEEARVAIATLLADTTEETRRWTDILACVLSRASYSDIAREVQRARRESVIMGETLETRFRDIVTRRIDGLSQAERINVAMSLFERGHSQYEVKEMTGVSRDTIRKHSKKLPATKKKEPSNGR